MKTTKALFFELMYDFQSERWNEFELPKLSLRELLALAKLLGCPSCGSKETVIVRLLAQRELRLKLARFTDNPEELAISYKRESLRDMCREAGIWRSGNKRALSAGLLNWRDRCRARGQAFLAEMRSLAKDRPQQLSFRFQVLSSPNLRTLSSHYVKFGRRPNQKREKRALFLGIVSQIMLRTTRVDSLAVRFARGGINSVVLPLKP